MKLDGLIYLEFYGFHRLLMCQHFSCVTCVKAVYFTFIYFFRQLTEKNKQMAALRKSQNTDRSSTGDTAAALKVNCYYILINFFSNGFLCILCVLSLEVVNLIFLVNMECDEKYLLYANMSLTKF